jgi:hypothetical protein
MKTMNTVHQAAAIALAMFCAPMAQAQEVQDKLRQEFGEGFATLQTEHWVIVYSTAEKEAREVGEALEKTRATYIETFDRADIELRKYSRILVCELHKDPASYVDHMKSVGRPRQPPSFGWYSTGTNRLTLIKTEMTEIEGLKISLIWTATHEGAHQLSYNYGPLERGSSYPPWLLEGLAGAFETLEPEAEFGPFSDHVTQKVQLIQGYAERAEHAPLLELSDMQRPPSRSLKDRFERVPLQRVQIYGQGASLVTYLITHRAEQLMTYVEALGKRRASGALGGRWRTAFKEAFGDVGALEVDWKRWLLALEPREDG